MLRDDVIYGLPLWPIVKGELNLHLGLPPILVWNQSCSVDTARWALERPLCYFMTPHYSRGFPRKHSNGSHTRKSYSGRSKAHLAVSTERVWFQTRGGALGVNRVRLLLWATMAARILRHHVVIARLRASLITSFQPPKLTPSARGC